MRVELNMNYSICNTAEYGEYAELKIINKEETKKRMKEVLNKTNLENLLKSGWMNVKMVKELSSN